jgi:hypothetical protein
MAVIPGFVYYRGPSTIDGKPIVAIMTGLGTPSPNSKTGPMIQGYFLHPDIAPLDAARSGEDERICGGCRHRGRVVVEDGASKNIERSCYVTLFQGPRVVYRSYVAGRYPIVDLDEARSLLRGRRVRLGAYGDPASIPVDRLRAVMKDVRGHTGYTHLWRENPGLSDLLMASCDTPAERTEAKALGYRTFRPRLADEPVLDGEGQCPASAEMGKVTTCADCLICDGQTRGLRSDITLLIHGVGAGNYRRHREQERAQV